jgi:hypothetical protein
MVISQRHMFERRIGVFPAGFCADGQMFCNTYLGDYPQFVPGSGIAPATVNSAGWMLLSRGKKAEASSQEEKFPVTNAFDENIQTWWCAKTGDAGEWLKVDLGKVCRVEAVQVNFADEGAQIRGKLAGDAYQYYIEASPDGAKWTKIIDRSNNQQDAPHDYTQLEEPVEVRYVRFVNVHCPAHARLSISDFRIFGNGLGRLQGEVEGVTTQRNPTDGRKATISWKPCDGAEFYIVRYGIAPNRLFLFNNYQVYDATNVQINSLNRDVTYYFTVDAVNDSGVVAGRTTSLLNP